MDITTTTQATTENVTEVTLRHSRSGYTITITLSEGPLGFVIHAPDGIKQPLPRYSNLAWEVLPERKRVHDIIGAP